MSLLDKASLVVTPNSYKESKLYSVVPNTTLGDMDVVRATTATRVNSAGLIEVVPRNLLTYSEEFDNAAWTKTNVTVTANSTNSPYGALTADTLNKSATGVDGTVVRIVTATATGYVGSIFVKKDTNTSRFPEFFLRSSDPVGENEIYVQLNTSTGATSIRLQFGTASVTAPVLINDYWRISFYALANSNTFRFGIRPAAGTTLGVFNSNATGSIIAWGAQVEDGSTATEYFPTTTRLNIPRIDYTNGSCPSLLVEPQRTNLFTYSDKFDSSVWDNSSGVTFTSNIGVSPDGTQNADRLLGLGAWYTARPLILTLGNTYTYTIYVKSNTGSNQTFRLFSNGVNVLSPTLTANNQWQRFTLTFTANVDVYQGIICDASFSNADLLVWGAQMEVGSYATSYIPTVASAVTRNADVISKTGVSSLIGQTEGTIFIEADNKILGQTNRTLFYVSDATANNFITVNYSAAQANTIRFFVVANGGVGALTFIINTASIVKIAVTYKNGVNKIFINGSLIYTQTGASFSSNLAELYLGTNRNLNEPIAERIKSFQMYKTELTSTECIALTTL